MPLLECTHHNWKGGLTFVNVDPPKPPRTWRALGILPLRVEGPCNAYGGWPTRVHQVMLQRRWDTEIPPEVQAAYKACPRHQVVRVDLGGYVIEEIRRDRSEAVVGRAETPIAAGTAMDWGALSALPHLTDLSVHGAVDANHLIEHLRTHPLIEELSWAEHDQARIDLSSTRLITVSVRVAAPLALVLPGTVRQLYLHGEPGLVAVVAPREGAALDLSVGLLDALPTGLRRLRGLRITRSRVIDLALVAASFPELVHLETFGDVVELTSVARLADLTGLRTLHLRNCYGLAAAELPPAEIFPDLDLVEIDGHRKEDSALIRSRLGSAPRFALRGGKTAAWLAANLGNPFRDWVDRDARKGKKAAAAWRTAHLALTPPPSARASEQILKTFIDVFNALELADTIDREEVFEALVGLAEGAGLDGDTAERWFGAWADF